MHPPVSGGMPRIREIDIPRAWFVSSVISPKLDSMTATFPVRPPAMALNKSICQSDVDVPKKVEASATPVSPLMMMGFRPSRSSKSVSA